MASLGDLARLALRHWRGLFAAVAAISLILGGLWVWSDFAAYQLRIVSKDAALADAHIAGFTYGLLLLSGFSSAISLVGVVAVLRTLVATREIGENQNRAYAHVASAVVTWRHAASAPVLLPFTIENDGQTPALSVQLASLEVSSVRNLGEAPLITVRPRVPRAVPLVARTPRVFPAALDEGEYRALISASLGEIHSDIPAGRFVWITVQGAVEYRDVFGSWFRTSFRFDGRLEGPAGQAVLIAMPGEHMAFERLARAPRREGKSTPLGADLDGVADSQA